MGYNQQYSKLEDFISACKNNLREDDTGLRTIFFDIQTKTVPVKFRQGTQTFDGKQMTATAFISAISRDGMEYITHSAHLGMFDIIPETTQEQIAGFIKEMDGLLQSQFVQFVEEKFETADKKRGVCGPTVA